MSPYQATVHTRGYPPMPIEDDDPRAFDTAQEAWAYLAKLLAANGTGAVYDDHDLAYSVTYIDNDDPTTRGI